MLIELLHDLGAGFIAFLVVAAGLLVWRLLRRVPFVMVGLGTAALGLAVAIAFALKDMNLRTEGSPAGLVILVVLGSVALAAAVAGLGMLGTGFVEAGKRSGTSMLGALLSMAVVAIGMGSYVANTGNDRGRQRAAERAKVEAPARKALPASETSVQRRAEAGDAYELAWKARGDAPALEMRIPATRFESQGLKVEETNDGPRSVPLLLEGPQGLVTLTLHRDDTLLENAVHAGLYGKHRRSDPEPHALRVLEEKGEWRVLGFDCPATATGAHPDLARELSLGCAKPEGFFARFMPGGSSRAAVDMRPSGGGRGECRMAFLYRGRPAEVSPKGACFAAPTLDALEASIRLLERLARERNPPLAPARLAELESATALCERVRDLDTCRYALRFANAEVRAQPAAVAPAILRIVETGTLGRSAERNAWVNTALGALHDGDKTDSRETVHGHLLRLDVQGLDNQSRLASLSVLMRLGPEVLQASDPLFDRVVAALRDARLHPTEEPMRLAALEALEAKSKGR